MIYGDMCNTTSFIRIVSDSLCFWGCPDLTTSRKLHLDSLMLEFLACDVYAFNLNPVP